MSRRWFPSVIALWSTIAIASESPRIPLLRVEADMHTAPIDGVSADANGLISLTVSHDKSARIWEVSSGRLLRVLRPPSGDGDEGKLFCGALSPDGSRAAVAGWTGPRYRGKAIYIFDTASGKVVVRIGQLDVITALAFSSDGRRLAAGLNGGHGIRLFDAASGKLLGEDQDYSAASHGLDFSPDGTHLVSTCWDGFVRLYSLSAIDSNPSIEGPFRMVPIKRAKGTKEPYGVSYSPNGKEIAVACGDRICVVLLSAEDLTLLFAPDIKPIDQIVGRVAWSKDGQTLYAGGHWSDAGKFLVCRWDERGRGGPKQTPASLNTLMGLRSLPGGQLLFGAGDPSWGVIDARGQRSLWKEMPIADFRAGGEAFRLSSDAGIVGFEYGYYEGKHPTQFSLVDRQLNLSNNDAGIQRTGTELRAPRQSGLPISGWEYGTTPRLGGKLISLDKDENSYSLAIAADSSFFVLGTGWWLRCFSADGTPRWKVAATGPVYAANISLDGKFVVAGYGDGTIRWHRADTGRELLVFFPHADQRRWVLWSTELNPEQGVGVGITLRSQNRILVVTDVVSHSAADDAGVRKGDQLLTFNGIIPTSIKDAVDIMNAVRKGEVSRMGLRRKFKKVEVMVRPKEETIPAGPEGVYYDCSPGAEDLIGWHMNRDEFEAGDFFPASRFRAVYYRPDVIQRVLKTLDTTDALRQANASLGRPSADPKGLDDIISRLSPPIVELATGGVLGMVRTPKDAHSVAVRYRVRQTGREAPTRVSVRFNGRPVDVEAPLPANGKEAEVDVPLPDGVEGEVSIIAEHKFGASEAAILRVRRENGSPPARKPDLYIIACGVAHLQANEVLQDGTAISVRKQGVRKDAEWRLSFDDLLYAGDDARTFAGLFGSQEGKAYARVIPTVLVDKQATTAAITDALDDVKRKARPGDVVVVFFSGHGHFIPDPGFLLITHDTNPQNLAGTALTGQELARRLAEIRGSVVLALDTCYSGAALEGDKQVRAVTGPGDLTGLVNQLSSSEKGVVIISSSAENQSSFEDEREKQGVFTRAVAEGFAGGAVENGEITCASLQKWVSERVPVLARKADPKAEQYPACIMPKGVPDFTLAMP